MVLLQSIQPTPLLSAPTAVAVSPPYPIQGSSPSSSQTNSHPDKEKEKAHSSGMSTSQETLVARPSHTTTFFNHMECINIGSHHKEFDPTMSEIFMLLSAVASARVYKFWSSTWKMAAG
ncbi:hypothetical protein Adt_42315 [Abeliophyllum distichum]|uniref:Uncharacterized protein n=1 Tax=Abeliophyllum distichum TaxID=126358 RepID=A0ABD1PU30_9LAMI